MPICSRSRPACAKVVRIGQSDWVGTVGMTGWATGPHLHFELKVHDAHVNPLTAELPAAEPLAVVAAVEALLSHQRRCVPNWRCWTASLSP